MVASIGLMASGQHEYYLKLAREDYYLNGGEPPGQWFGAGARRLGLSGTVQAQHLGNVLNGFSPTGEKSFVKSAGKENHQPGWDVTFSAPKSVSIVWGVADSDLRKQIEEAHTKAVTTALEYLQEQCYARTGKAGQTLVKADPIVATFLHGTSRELDPTLHTHCLFANVGLFGDGQSRTLKSPILYDHKMTSGAIYRAALAYGLRQMGFEPQAVQNWFEIKGVSEEARNYFSKRRQAILEATGPNATAKEKDLATLLTRSVKQHVARDRLHSDWQREASAFGITAERMRSQVREQSPSQKRMTERAEKALKESLRQLAESESSHKKQHLLRSVLTQLQTGEVDPGHAMKTLDEEITRGMHVWSLGKSDATQTEYLTSPEIAASENRLLQVASSLARQNEDQDRHDKARSERTTAKVLAGGILGEGKRRVQAFVDEKLPACLRFKFERIGYGHLNEGQRAAVMDITTNPSKLRTLVGVAGSGKTTMLAAARESWEAQGYNVVGCSVSGVAAQELAKGAGIDSATVSMTLLRLEPDRMRRLRHHARMLVREFFKKPTFKFEQMKLDSRSVLVVDEASMMSSGDLRKVLEHAQNAKAKVVLVGDNRQLPSVGQGGGFAKIHEEVKGCELTESVRQKTPWLKKAVKLLNEGDVRGSLSEFVKSDRLSLNSDEQQRRKELISKWAAERTDDLSETVILASRNSDVDALNLAAQDVRRRNGELERAKFTWDGVTYHVGDRVEFHRTDYKLGVLNGSSGQIRHIANPINRFAVRIGVELDSGELVTVVPGRLKDKRDISLGYASTVHKAQGRTVDKTFLMLDEQLATQQSTYVGLTRSRHDTFLYAPSSAVGEDVEEQHRLEKKMSRDGAKRLAMEQQRMLEEERLRKQHARSESPVQSRTRDPLVQELQR